MLIRSSWIFDSILVDVWVIAMDDCGLWIDVRLFSSAEKEFLASQRKVFNDAVVNFLSVRRSMMFFDLKRLSPFGTFWKHQVGNMHVWYQGFHVKWHTRNIDVQQPRIVKTFNLRVSRMSQGNQGKAQVLNTFSVLRILSLHLSATLRFVTGIFCILALAIQLAVVPKAFESRRNLG